MSNLKKLKSELTADEGYSDIIYLDTKGLKTIGIGHLLTPKDPEYKEPVGFYINPERIMELFKEDITNSLNDCRKVFGDWDSFQGELKLILANMMFNLGLPRFKKFQRFITAIEKMDYREAAKEMEDSLWFKQVTYRAQRLQKRMIALADCSLSNATI
jgi:lysozyme